MVLFEWLMDHVMPWFISVAIIALIGFCIIAPFAIWKDSQRPTFELKKDDWTCARAHQEQTTTYVKSGSVMIPVTSTYDVCDMYKRAGAE